MISKLGPLPHPVEVARSRTPDQERITLAYTTAQMEAERLRCYELGVAQEHGRCVYWCVLGDREGYTAHHIREGTPIPPR